MYECFNYVGGAAVGIRSGDLRSRRTASERTRSKCQLLTWRKHACARQTLCEIFFFFLQIYTHTFSRNQAPSRALKTSQISKNSILYYIYVFFYISVFYISVKSQYSLNQCGNRFPPSTSRNYIVHVTTLKLHEFHRMSLLCLSHLCTTPAPNQSICTGK